MTNVRTRVLRPLLISLGLLGATQVATAAPINHYYNFLGGSGDNVSSFTQTSAAGLSMTIAAYADYNSGTMGRVNRGLLGLGVSTAPPRFGRNRVGLGEALEFDFSPETVTVLNSIVFETGTGPGGMDIYVDGVLAVEDLRWNWAENIDLSGYGLTGTVFTFVNDDGAWRIAGLGVETEGGGGGASMPEPTSIALIGLGLAGIGLAKARSRKKKAARSA